MPKIVPIHWRRLEAVILASGYHFVRQEGSHRAYTREGTLRPIVIPTYTQVPVFVIRNNLKTAGLSRDQYFELLDRA